MTRGALIRALLGRILVVSIAVVLLGCVDQSPPADVTVVSGEPPARAAERFIKVHAEYRSTLNTLFQRYLDAVDTNQTAQRYWFFQAVPANEIDLVGGVSGQLERFLVSPAAAGMTEPDRIRVRQWVDWFRIAERRNDAKTATDVRDERAEPPAGASTAEKVGAGVSIPEPPPVDPFRSNASRAARTAEKLGTSYAADDLIAAFYRGLYIAKRISTADPAALKKLIVNYRKNLDPLLWSAYAAAWDDETSAKSSVFASSKNELMAAMQEPAGLFVGELFPGLAAPERKLAAYFVLQCAVVVTFGYRSTQLQRLRLDAATVPETERFMNLLSNVVKIENAIPGSQ
jgi:hypothetical protein